MTYNQILDALKKRPQTIPDNIIRALSDKNFNRYAFGEGMKFDKRKHMV